VNRWFGKLPSTSTTDTRSTLEEDPDERQLSRPTTNCSYASPSELRVEEASRKSESATGGANGTRAAVAIPATVLTPEVARQTPTERTVVTKVTGNAAS